MGKVKEGVRRDAVTRHGKPAAGPAAAWPSARPLLLGHRGARPVSRFRLRSSRKKVPAENTLACFEYALENGCDGFEFDVRLTRDERLVVCHDAQIGRRSVAASSFESLCAATMVRLACLEDVLQTFGQRAYLNIEVKIAGGEETIAAALKQHSPRCGYLISSFLPEVLLRFHQLDRSLPLGYVCQVSVGVPLWHKLPIQVFLPHYKLVTEKLVSEVHRSKRQIFTWTVNRERDMHRLSAWGVDGFISDDPGLLASTFVKAGALAKSE